MSWPKADVRASPINVRYWHLADIAHSGTTVDAARLTAEFDRRRIELKPGTILTRAWNGQLHRVMVVDAGFAWNGKTHHSLSKIAFAITGSKWNGPRFFGLRQEKRSDQPASTGPTAGKRRRGRPRRSPAYPVEHLPRGAP